MRKNQRSERITASEAPTLAQLEAELRREMYWKRHNRILRSTVYALITAAAAAVLVATLFLPVLRIYGSSMTPTLADGDIVVSVKVGNFEQGDLIAFWFNNKILVKRVIAGAGEWVDIDEKGNVSVDGRQLEEPYLTEKALGDCDIDLPCQVPEGRIFVLGDHRSTSTDSRSSTVGFVSEEQIAGRLVFRIWPLSGFGPLQ